MAPEGSDELVNREQLYQGERLTLRRDTWRSPSGRTHAFEVIDSVDAVVIVAVDADGGVLLVRQHRAGPERELLECPAGGIDAGETPLECAQRELREETGYAADSLLELGSFWTVPGFATERMYAFLATGLHDDPLPPDEDESLSLERMPLSEALALARAGGLFDAKSIAALFMAEPRVGGAASSG